MTYRILAPANKTSFIRGVFGDDSAATGYNLYETFYGKSAEGLTHRTAADFEAFGDFLLVESLAGGEGSAQNSLAESGDDDFLASLKGVSGADSKVCH